MSNGLYFDSIKIFRNTDLNALQDEVNVFLDEYEEKNKTWVTVKKIVFTPYEKFYFMSVHLQQYRTKEAAERAKKFQNVNTLVSGKKISKSDEYI